MVPVRKLNRGRKRRSWNEEIKQAMESHNLKILIMPWIDRFEGGEQEYSDSCHVTSTCPYL